MLHPFPHGSPSLNISLPLFSPFHRFIVHLFIPLTNLPYTHRFSLSDLIFQYYCLLPFSGHSTPPPVHHSLTSLTINVCFPFTKHTHTRYTKSMLYAELLDCICSQLCRFAVNPPPPFLWCLQCGVWGRRPWDTCPAAVCKLPQDGGQFCCHTWQHGRTGGHPLQYLVMWSHTGPGGAFEIHRYTSPGQCHAVPGRAGLWYRC